MNPDEAPVGTLTSVGHPGNGIVARKVNDTDWIYLHNGDKILDFDTVYKAMRALWVPGHDDGEAGIVLSKSEFPDDYFYVAPGNVQIECNYCSDGNYVFGSFDEGFTQPVFRNARSHYDEHHFNEGH